MPNRPDLLTFIEHGFHQDEFLRLVGHELRTPLTVIQLEAQSFRRMASQKGALAFDVKRVSRLVETVETQTKFLSSLINTMLDLNCLRSGSFHLEKQKINFTQLLSDVCDSLNISPVRQKNDFILADQVRLRVALISLLEHFISFHGANDVSIKYFARAQRIYLTISSKDSSVKNLDQQCQLEFSRGVPFKQLKDSAFKNYLAQEIICLHDGFFKMDGKNLKISLPKAGAE